MPDKKAIIFKEFRQTLVKVSAIFAHRMKKSPGKIGFQEGLLERLERYREVHPSFGEYPDFGRENQDF